MNTQKFKSQEFTKYVKERALQIIKEGKEISSLGDPTKFGMNKNAENNLGDTGAKVTVDKVKTEAPKNIPSDVDTTKNPVDIKMTERDGGSDESWSTAAAIKGTESKKPGVKNHADGLANPDVTSKKDNPKVSVEADPTKEGGIPGDGNNTTEMNKEDSEDKQITPKTQVLGKGEKSEEGFSKGQTAQEVNVNAKQEADQLKTKLDTQIQTIQLPESFSSKKEFLSFMKKEAVRISKTL